MKRRMALALVLVLTACATGCVSTQSKEYTAYRKEVDSWSYPKKVYVIFKDLILDFGDIVSFDAALGEGFLAHAQATKLVEGGLGYTNTLKFVYDRRGVGFVRETRKEGGLGPVYYRDLTTEFIHGTKTLAARAGVVKDYSIRHNEMGHWADVGVDGHALFVGVGVRVSPKEAMDFAMNLVSAPFNLVVRPVLSLFHIYPPEVDFSEDDTAAAVRRKYNLILIEQHPGFGPAETVNKWVEVPY